MRTCHYRINEYCIIVLYCISINSSLGSKCDLASDAQHGQLSVLLSCIFCTARCKCIEVYNRVVFMNTEKLPNYTQRHKMLRYIGIAVLEVTVHVGCFPVQRFSTEKKKSCRRRNRVTEHLRLSMIVCGVASQTLALSKRRRADRVAVYYHRTLITLVLDARSTSAFTRTRELHT